MTDSTPDVNVEESSVSTTMVGSALLLNTKNHHDNTQDQDDDELQVSFSHVQLYVDHVKDLKVYKQLEHALNHYANQVQPNMTLSDKHQLYHSLLGNDFTPPTSSSFVPQNRDVIEQLIAGFGFRITACRYPLLEPTTSNENSHCTINTRSVLVTSKDGMGAQFVITALHDDEQDNMDTAEAETQDSFHHFDASKLFLFSKREPLFWGCHKVVASHWRFNFFSFRAGNLRRFGAVHGNRQGIAVMGFAVNHVDLIRQRYQRLHPKLIHSYSEYQGDGNDAGTIVKILEVFAYYNSGSMDSASPSSMGMEADGDVEEHQDGSQHEKPQVDLGTLLRFVQRYRLAKEEDTCSTTWLPGLSPVEATFDKESQPVYCDHWVSNVISRTGFLQTLEDTLGFTPKVDFNAGVVAAGEAQIESTVTGNDSRRRMADKRDALRDQSQVYLPINNALSEVG
jgi:hypothetical protein